MKALSVRQPWADAIIFGGKDVENRSDARGVMPALCRARGRILIHASASRPTRQAAEAAWNLGFNLPDDPSDIPTGCIIGSVDVVGHVNPSGKAWADQSEETPLDWTPTKWWEGGWGMILRDPRPCLWTPCKGMLGLWQAPPVFSLCPVCKGPDRPTGQCEACATSGLLEVA